MENESKILKVTKGAGGMVLSVACGFILSAAMLFGLIILMIVANALGLVNNSNSSSYNCSGREDWCAEMIEMDRADAARSSDMQDHYYNY